MASNPTEMSAAEIDEKAAALNRLADAAERARTELQKLSETRHGGLEIAMNGNLMHCTVKPPSHANKRDKAAQAA